VLWPQITDARGTVALLLERLCRDLVSHPFPVPKAASWRSRWRSSGSPGTAS
jgi:hypothetical protein